ncbi:hypothetical protein B590_30428 (plasmid) [Streptomyces sp. PVA_94-07]|uniref:hypothetical protein n=1 Tax=Streptomyces sp. PVA_94-07 TaxID=1225337 RepID=UPI0003C322D6|nr:hypothetical protein [Streptomyces sp. PVA_94-07]ESQ01789.1 hypothetical protein B590_30428 [Streptomyces sp. PVA_94-07]
MTTPNLVATAPAATSVHQVFVFARAQADLPDTKDHVTSPGVAYYVDHDGIVRCPTREEVGADKPIPPAFLGNYWAPEIADDIPVAMRALAARDAALNGVDSTVDRFATEVLGLWRGGRWHEPVSTALLGNWADPLVQDGGRITPAFLDAFKAEVKTLHRAFTPLWRRRTGGHRLWSLDFCLADGLTLHDLASSGPDPYEVLTGALPDDPRIVRVLNRLTPVERAVTMAWASWSVTSWTEAAAEVTALAPDRFAGCCPEALGDSVRRRLKRLGQQHRDRAAAARGE